MSNPLSMFQKPSLPVYLKMGIYGNAGSGKTYTASLIAIGVAKAIESKKPVAIFDTETGSDYLTPLFEKNGVPFVVIKTRSFADLLKATKEAEKSASILVIDSITHVWDELISAYQAKLNKDRLSLGDWMPIKGQWKLFTELFINSPQHIIMCGRLQDITDMVQEEGKWEVKKTGTRMKTEKHMGYEPSLLVEMEGVQDLKTKAMNHLAYVMKDRTDSLTGVEIVNPTFESFRKVWDKLDLKGEHTGVDLNKNTEDLVKNPDWSAEDRSRRRKIACENIQNTMVKFIPGIGAKDKQAKLNILEQVLGTASWTAIEEDWKAVRLEDLEASIQKIEDMCKEYVGTPVAGTVSMEQAKKLLATNKK